MTEGRSPRSPRDQEDTFEALVRAVRRRWWVVVAVAAVVVVVAGALGATRSKSYTATAQILVAPVSQDATAYTGIPVLRDSNDPSRTLQTAASLLQSPVIASDAARRAGGGATQSDVEDAVSVQPLGASSLVGVAATASSPERAQQLANAYANAALAQRDRVVREKVATTLAGIVGGGADAVATRQQLNVLARSGDTTVDLSQTAPRPAGADGTSLLLILVAAGFAGLVLGVLAALLLERVDRRVRDRAALAAAIPVPVLARVPTFPANKGGLDVPADVREAFRTLQIQLDVRRSAAPGCRSVLVTGASTGDGSTTAVLNLAFALVGAGHRVIVMDFDLRDPSLERQLGLDTSAGLLTLLDEGTSLASLLRAAPRLAPLRVVPAAAEPGDIALLPSLARRLDALLTEAAGLADYVVIDTSPLGEVGDALALAEHVDDVLVVGRPGATDRRKLGVMADLLHRGGVAPTGWIVTGDAEVAPAPGSSGGAGGMGGATRRGPQHVAPAATTPRSARG